MIIDCPECKKEISFESEKCIYCGYPLREKRVNIFGSRIKCSQCQKEISENTEVCPYCNYSLRYRKTIINGDTYDLSPIFEIYNIDENKRVHYKEYNMLTIMGREKGYILDHRDNFFIVDYVLDTGEVPEKFDLKYTPKSITEVNREREEYKRKHPECPYCKSTDTKKIKALDRGFSFGFLGFGSSKVNKQWHCNSCNSNF